MAAGYLAVWVTGRDDIALAPGLAQSLSGAVQALSFGERAKGLLHSLDKVQVELGVPGAKMAVELAATRESALVERPWRTLASSLATTTTRVWPSSSTSSKTPASSTDDPC